MIWIGYPIIYRLNSMEPTLLKLEKKFGVNVCGEGGEYETYTLDSPLFIKVGHNGDKNLFHENIPLKTREFFYLCV